MNRAQRRKAEREKRSREYLNGLYLRQKEYDRKLTEGQKELDRLKATTSQDIIDLAYQKGYREGMAEGSKLIIKRYYSATIMALNELYGFGQQRCIKTLHRIEECLIENLTDIDLVEAVQKKLGIEIDMDEGINRAQPMTKGGGDICTA